MMHWSATLDYLKYRPRPCRRAARSQQALEEVDQWADPQSWGQIGEGKEIGVFSERGVLAVRVCGAAQMLVMEVLSL